MFQYQVVRGNQSVVITANDEAGPFSCRVYVNVRGGQPGDATLVSCTRKSLQGQRGAMAWALKQIAA